MRGAALPSNSDLSGENAVRRPRLRVTANGAPLPGAISAEILSNNHYSSDRFTIRAAVTAPEAALWSDTQDALIDIQIALDGNDWTSLIQGEVDQLLLSPLTGLLVLSGRDLTARLIEARTQETFANQTSSEIAKTLADRHGLESDIDATTTKAGAYWQLEHDSITLNSFGRTTTEWDLLVTLAGHEGFDVWVSGTTLHFKAPNISSTASSSLRSAATVNGPANLLSLQLERSLTLARDIIVVVKSWNSRQAHAFTQTARATRLAGIANGGPKAPPQRYVFIIPNLSPDAAIKIAQIRLAELSRHERVVIAEMPGELFLAPRQIISLEATHTGFDQDYVIDEINRHISVSHGFVQTLRAKNHDVGSTVTTPAEPIGGASWNDF